MRKERPVSINQRWVVEGKVKSPMEFVRIASEQGNTLSRATVCRRLASGATKLEDIIKPTIKPKTSKAASSQRYRDRKKSEMLELVERMGPPKRY